jgi:hypothetical protein
MSYINMNTVFASLDARFAEADAFIAMFTAEQVAEASRIALLYNRCAVTSLSHKEGIVQQLKELTTV